MQRRLVVNIDDTTKDRAESYADEHGVRMPRAYGELLQRGLDAEGVETSVCAHCGEPRGHREETAFGEFVADGDVVQALGMDPDDEQVTLCDGCHVIAEHEMESDH